MLALIATIQVDETVTPRATRCQRVKHTVFFSVFYCVAMSNYERKMT